MALILIADDDPLVGDIVRYTLAGRGHVVSVDHMLAKVESAPRSAVNG